MKWARTALTLPHCSKCLYPLNHHKVRVTFESLSNLGVFDHKHSKEVWLEAQQMVCLSYYWFVLLVRHGVSVGAILQAKLVDEQLTLNQNVNLEPRQIS